MSVMNFSKRTLIGATTMSQLKENIASIDIKLSDEIIDKINKIHNDNTNPTPYFKTLK